MARERQAGDDVVLSTERLVMRRLRENEGDVELSGDTGGSPSGFSGRKQRLGTRLCHRVRPGLKAMEGSIFLRLSPKLNRFFAAEADAGQQRVALIG